MYFHRRRGGGGEDVLKGKLLDLNIQNEFLIMVSEA